MRFNKIIISIFGIFFAFVFFLIVMLKFYQYTVDLDKMSVKNSVNQFQKDVRKKGYITKQLYMNLASDIGSTGIYKIELIHGQPRVYPLKPTDRLYKADKPWIELEEKHYSNEILPVILGKDSKDYYMEYGDDFEVRVTKVDKTALEYISSMIGLKYYEPLDFKLGGKVQNDEVH